MGSIQPARAGGLPRIFLEVLAESRAGAALIESMGALPRGVSPVSQLALRLELHPDFRTIRRILEAKAQRYGEVLAFERSSEASRSFREIESAMDDGVSSLNRLSPEARKGTVQRLYRTMTSEERDVLLQMMEMGPHYGVEGLTEFLPRSGQLDLVGMTRPPRTN